MFERTIRRHYSCCENRPYMTTRRQTHPCSSYCCYRRTSRRNRHDGVYACVASYCYYVHVCCPFIALLKMSSNCAYINLDEARVLQGLTVTLSFSRAYCCFSFWRGASVCERHNGPCIGQKCRTLTFTSHSYYIADKRILIFHMPKHTSAAAASSQLVLESVADGGIQLPDSILRNFQLDNDLPLDQRAEYASVMDADTIDQANLDPSIPTFAIDDYMSNGNTDYDELMTTPSPEFYGTTMSYTAGVDEWPRVKPGQIIPCKYEGYPLDEGQLIVMHPEEWDPQVGFFKCWGAWCSRTCWRTWLKESNQFNKGHSLLGMSALSIVVWGDTQDDGGSAPPKDGLLEGWGGVMPVAEYRNLGRRGSSGGGNNRFEKHTSRLITNGMLIPTPVIRQIDYYNEKRRVGAHATLNEVYGMDEASEVQKAELLHVLGEHAVVSTVNAGVWFDTLTQTWVDIHNAVEADGGAPCLTPHQ